MIRRVAIGAMLLLLSAGSLSAQGGGNNRGVLRNCSWGSWGNDGYWIPSAWNGNLPYTGRFTWVRLAYIGGGMCQQEGPGWAHDFPRSDTHFMKILNAVSNMHPHFDSTNVFRLDNPDVMKYPVAYLSEPSETAWTMNPKEFLGLQAYLRKGGFLIVDDFRGTYWWGFVAIMRQVLPEAQILQIPREHPIFDSFYRLDMDRISSDIVQYGVRYGDPEWYGIFANNDPKGRLIAVINYQCDLGEFMEYADEGYAPVDINNEVFKLFVNYVVYAMTR